MCEADSDSELSRLFISECVSGVRTDVCESDCVCSVCMSHCMRVCVCERVHDVCV